MPCQRSGNPKTLKITVNNPCAQYLNPCLTEFFQTLTIAGVFTFIKIY